MSECKTCRYHERDGANCYCLVRKLTVHQEKCLRQKEGVCIVYKPKNKVNHDE